jgi:hypothetical protein
LWRHFRHVGVCDIAANDKEGNLMLQSKWNRWFAKTIVMAMALVTVAVCVVPDVHAQAPITTVDLRRIIGNPRGLVGIQYNREVGLRFQKDVLAHLAGLKFVYPNTKPFPSPLREQRTSNRHKSVIPDGVAGATIGAAGAMPMITTTYPESTFIEVKAVKGTVSLAYGRHQIAGMLDVLSRSQAASSVGDDRAYPNLYFVITADTIVSPDVAQDGVKRKILVWQSYVLEVKGRLVVAPPTCMNCFEVLVGAQIQNVLVPGTPFTLGPLGGTAPGGLDAPILDDNLLGSPGVPGTTAPNP